MDFVHDALADGRPFRILTVVDHWSRHSPLLEVAARQSGRSVGKALDRVLNSATVPRSITVDHGTEFQSRALEDLAIELRGPRLAVDVLNALIDQMPMELRLELVATVGSDGVNPERERLDHIVEEVDGVLLGMPWVNLDGADARGVINGRELVATRRLAGLVSQLQERDIQLHVVPVDLLGVEARSFAIPLSGDWRT